MSEQLLDEHFHNMNVTIRLWPESTTLQFSEISTFHDFIVDEKKFWSVVYGEVSSHFQNIENNLDQAYQYVNSNLEHAKNLLQQAVNFANKNEWPAVYSRTSAAQFIKKQLQQSPLLGEAAIQYLLRRQLHNINTFEYFRGYMSSYLFEESERSFNEAAAAQEATLRELHQDYLEQISNLNEEYHHITTKWKDDYSTKVNEWKKGAEDFQGDVLNWRHVLQLQTETALKTTMAEFEKIKKTYAEHLRLQGPAQYWKVLETDYEKSGNRWRRWAVGSTLIFVTLLVVILLLHPDSTFVTNGVLNLNSIRNALIFTLITSVSIYLITLFVKLSVSSYHLARDAKERYQLTHIYLSLLNENEHTIKDAERVTVLQSIFSRADTGLLKGDSGPSIPDSLSQILKLLKK